MAATWEWTRSKSKRGAGQLCRRAIDDGAGDLGSPRTIGDYRSTQDAMRKLLVLALLPKGHRNMAVGEVKRRRSRAYGVVMIWDTMEWSEGTRRKRSSP